MVTVYQGINTGRTEARAAALQGTGGRRWAGLSQAAQAHAEWAVVLERARASPESSF